jgi:hypothetical protein
VRERGTVSLEKTKREFFQNGAIIFILTIKAIKDLSADGRFSDLFA